MDIELAKQVAVEALREAGKILAPHFGKLNKFSYKGKSNIVTEMDVEAETVIIGHIRAKFPDHKILSEEAGSLDGTAEYLWVIDPLEGTINYYYGIEPFLTQLCLLENGIPVITAMYDPLKDQLFFAERGKGATMNGTKMAVNSNAELKECIFMTHLSSKDEARVRTISALDPVFLESMQMRVIGCDTMHFIAGGMSAVYFNVKTNPWDILPGAFMLEEAGGTVTDIRGNAIRSDSDSVLASPNEKTHKRMLELLKNV